MFGKEQPSVVTDEQVGDYVKQLQKDTPNPLDYVGVNIDGLVTDSAEPSTEQKS